jgi:hypothetical protein
LSERVANINILCEDQEQQNLIRRYLNCLNMKNARYEPVPGKTGSGSQYVRTQFPKLVAVCRGTLGKRTKCLLIVMTDADNLTVLARERTLHDELTSANHPAITSEEPIVILIPKWQVETWIKCLLGQVMDEDDKDSDRPPVAATDIKVAAETLYAWARPNAPTGATCVPSLLSALPRWRRIG